MSFFIGIFYDGHISIYRTLTLAEERHIEEQTQKRIEEIIRKRVEDFLVHRRVEIEQEVIFVLHIFFTLLFQNFTIR